MTSSLPTIKNESNSILQKPLSNIFVNNSDSYVSFIPSTISNTSISLYQNNKNNISNFQLNNKISNRIILPQPQISNIDNNFNKKFISSIILPPILQEEKQQENQNFQMEK